MKQASETQSERRGSSRRHLNYANVAATLALVVAMSGTAYAAGTVRSSDIVNGQVKTADLGKNAVTTKKIKKNAVNRSRIKNNSITGAKIKDGTVGAGDLSAAAFSHFLVSDYDSTDTNVALNSGAAVTAVLSVELTTQVESHLMVTSNAEIDADGGNNDDAFCYLNKGSGAGSDDVSERVTVDIPATNLARGNIANHGNLVAPAGTHTITLFCGVNVPGQTIAFDSGDMWAIAVPIDADSPPGPPALTKSEARAQAPRGVEGN